MTRPTRGDVEVWTCPDCGSTYRMPGTWEVAIWLSTRRAAQYLHAQKHGRPDIAERRRRRDDPPIEDEPDTPTPG